MVLAGQGCFSSSLFFSLSLLPPPSQVELPTLRWLQFECPHSARSLAPWYCMVLRLLERFWCIPPNSAYLHFQVGRYLSREICLQVNFLPAFHHSLLFPLLIFFSLLVWPVQPAKKKHRSKQFETVSAILTLVSSYVSSSLWEKSPFPCKEFTSLCTHLFQNSSEFCKL